MATQTLPSDGQAKSRRSIKSYLLHSIPYVGMMVMAMVAIAYTDVAPTSSFTLWQLLAPVFGLICIGTQWTRCQPTTAARARMVGLQVLHWGMLWLTMQVFRLPTFIVVMTADSLGIAALLLLSLSTMLAGLYLNWRFFVVGVFMLAGAVVVGYLEEAALSLALLGFVGVVVLIVFYWLPIGRRTAGAA